MILMNNNSAKIEKDERPIRVMGKKLHYSYQQVEVIEFLKKEGFKISSVINKLERKTKKPLDIFILSFEHDQDIKKVYDLKYILHSKVEIEAYKRIIVYLNVNGVIHLAILKHTAAKSQDVLNMRRKHITVECKRQKVIKLDNLDERLTKLDKKEQI